jgi:protein TonB
LPHPPQIGRNCLNSFKTADQGRRAKGSKKVATPAIRTRKAAFGHLFSLHSDRHTCREAPEFDVYAPSSRRRRASALGSATIVGVGAAALIWGLAGAGALPAAVQETIVAISSAPEDPVEPQPSPSPIPQPSPTHATEAQSSRKRDEASPENLRNQASAVFAPVLPPLRIPPPIVAAPRPGAGNASNTGNSERIGPGQGAGGEGDGTGGGGNGDGNGNGFGNAVTRPVQTRGKLRWSDLPEDLRETRQGGELELTYRVNIDGRVSDCQVTQSSGLPALDARTCRLITERFRFRPSRDAAGRPVPSYIIESHGWFHQPDDDEAAD